MNEDPQMPTTLEELSSQLNISPSGLRKRIHALGLEVSKGSRGKWLIPDELLSVLEEADRLMKDGAGAATTRRVLGITLDGPSTDDAPTEEGEDDAHTDRGVGDHQLRTEGAPRTSGPELRQALELLAAERARSEALQGQVAELLGKVADLNGTSSMFQERALNLAATVAQLQDKVLLLEAPKEDPAPARPWWKVWA